jgi:peptidyl-prolyl cis-trans isomerase B (cyclophilin B)
MSIRRLWLALITITALAVPADTVTASTDESDRYWVIDTTGGRIVVEFRPDAAPNTVRQFTKLIDLGIFDGVNIGRIVPNFVVQVADAVDRQTPLTADQQAAITTLDLETSDELLHTRGTVSLAHVDGDVNSGATSFSFVVADSPHLDGQYTAFGEVVQGMDVVDALNRLPTSAERPLLPIVIEASSLQAAIADPVGPLPALLEATALAPSSGLPVTLWIGDIQTSIRFFDDTAPQTAGLIRGLIESGAFNNQPLGRVNANWVQVFPVPASGITIDTPPVARPFTRGTVAVLASPAPGSQPSGFTVLLADNPNMATDYLAIGEVTLGLDDLALLPTRIKVDADSQPTSPIWLSSLGPSEIRIGGLDQSDVAWVVAIAGVMTIAAAAAFTLLGLTSRRTALALGSLGVAALVLAAFVGRPFGDQSWAATSLFVIAIVLFRLMARFERPQRTVA